MSEPNDNAVTVASAQLAEMRDFLVVPHNHVTIRYSEQVSQQILIFLREGRFVAPQSVPSASLPENVVELASPIAEPH